MSSSVPQSPPEGDAVVPRYGASTSDGQDHRRVEVPSDSPPDLPIHAKSSTGATEDFSVSERTPLLQPPPNEPAHDSVHDVKSTEQTPTYKMLREETRVLVEYSLPVLGAQLFEYSFIMSSVVAIGHISTLALAAASLAAMTGSVTGYSIVLGFTSSLETLLPPAWTSDKPHMVGLWTQRTALFTGMILLPIAAVWFKAEPILLALNQDPEVARLAGIYLRWESLGLPAYTFNCISRRYFQSQGLFTTPTRIVMVVAPINAFLNWLFVYPLGLSFPGAAIATALSFNLVSVAYIFYGYLYAPRAAWSPITRESLNLTSGEIWKGWGLLAKLGFAGICQTASEWWSWEFICLAASQLGPVTLAAQSVLINSATTTYQAPSALSAAASVRIGNLLGEGKARRAGLTAAASIAMAAALGCFFSSIFLIFRHKWSYLFNNDREVALLVASVFPILALLQVVDGVAAVISGVFRARGKQVSGAILSLSAYYVLGIPLGLYLAFVRGRELVGLWEGLTIGLACSAGVGYWLAVHGVDWAAEVTIARERVGGKD